MEHLGSSSLEDWPSYLESSPGETTAPAFPVSRRAFFALSLHLAPGLVAVSIFLLLLLLVLAFGSTLLISWAIAQPESSASSTVVSLSESDSDGSMARREFCSPSLLCDGSRAYSEDGPSLSESGMWLRRCGEECGFWREEETPWI